MPTGVYERRRKKKAKGRTDPPIPSEPKPAEIERTKAIAATLAFDEAVKDATKDAKEEAPAMSAADAKAALDSLAFAVNTFGDMVGHTPAGTAQKCNLGQAWVTVAQHYLPRAASHPITGAVFCTGQFALVAISLHAMRKQAAKRDADKGPSNPGDNQVVGQTATTNGSAKQPGDNLFDMIPDLAEPQPYNVPKAKRKA